VIQRTHRRMRQGRNLPSGRAMNRYVMEVLLNQSIGCSVFTYKWAIERTFPPSTYRYRLTAQELAILECSSTIMNSIILYI
jgi:hypothetical protein